MRFLARLDGYLTTTPSGSPAATVKDYLSDKADAFGVSPSDVSDLKLSDRTDAGGVQSLDFTQMVGGVPVVDSSVQAHLDDAGRLIAITGGLVPDPERRHQSLRLPGGCRGGGHGRCGRRRRRRHRHARGLYVRGPAATGLAGVGQGVVHGPVRHARGRRHRQGGAAEQPREVRVPVVRQLSGSRIRGHRDPARSQRLPHARRHRPDRSLRPRFRRSQRRGAGERPEQPHPQPALAGRDAAHLGERLQLPLRAVEPEPGHPVQRRLRPAVQVQLGSQGLPGLGFQQQSLRHPALLLREPVSRPPQGPAHRLRRGVRQLRGERGGPGS